MRSAFRAVISCKELIAMPVRQFPVFVIATKLFAMSVLLPWTLNAAPPCELNRPLVLAGLDWNSNRLNNSIIEYMLVEGYGCEVEIMAGSSLSLLDALIDGRVDIKMEVWKENYAEAWAKGESAGSIVDLGVNFAHLALTTVLQVFRHFLDLHSADDLLAR